MKTKNKIPEGKLLKALAELEDHVEKGDVLQDADPEGGLSTEGTPLSAKAPSGKSDTRKSRAASSSDMASDDDDTATAKAFSASDMMSPKEKKKKDKTEKSFPPKKGDSDDDSSSDNTSSDDGDDAEKSLRDNADQDETMSKAIEVSDFLEAMVDQVSLTILTMSKSFQKAIGDMESRLNARIDNRVSKGISMSSDFNARLAKAITAIGTSVEESTDLVKSLQNAPVAPRGKALLSKSDVHQPPWGGAGGTHADLADGSDGDLADLSQLSPEKIGDWLFQKSSAHQIDPKLILAWEADRYNTEALPAQVRKALVNDLCK